MASLKKALTGSFLLSFESVLRKLVGLVSTLILARMLVPEDFGIIAIALMTMGLLEALKQFGGGAYILRAKTVTPGMLNTSWTIGFISSSFMAILSILLIPVATSYFEDDRLHNILLVYASLIIVKAAGNPGKFILKKEQNYLPIVKVTIIGKIISVIIAISVALTMKNYWALIAGQYAMALNGTIGSYFIHHHRPKLCLTGFKKQWQFSSWWLLQSIIGYCKSQADTFIVGSLFNKASLGSYHTIKYLASFPTTYLIGPAIEPLLAQLAPIKDNKNYFNQQYIISLIAPLCIAIPGCVFIFNFHELLTLTILGDNWQKYSVLFAVLCINIVTILIQNHANRVLVIHAKTKQLFYFQLVSFGLLYSYILTNDITSIYDFAIIIISFEFAFACVFFTYVSICYTSLKNYLLCLITSVPIIIASIFAIIISNLISFQAPLLIEFIITAISFGIIFLTLLIIQIYLLKGISKEWCYIWNLIVKIFNYFTEKLHLTKKL